MGSSCSLAVSSTIFQLSDHWYLQFQQGDWRGSYPGLRIAILGQGIWFGTRAGRRRRLFRPRSLLCQGVSRYGRGLDSTPHRLTHISDKHFDAIKPIIAKGKQCYVEWPLGKNLQEAEELQALALKSGSPRTLVGLQARRSPVVNKVKQLIADDAIGNVLSVTIRGAAGMSGAVEGEEMGRLLNDKKIGASIFTIHFGHMIDFVLYALGQDVKALNATVSTQRKTSKLKLANGSLEEIKRETPDHVLLQGHLANDALIDVALRGGSAFKDSPGFVWNIYGEKGEIEVTAPGVVLNVGFGPVVSVKLHDHEKDTVEVIDWSVDDEQEKLPVPSQNVGRLYQAFAEGKKDEYADWAEAIATHMLLEKMMKTSEKGVAVSL